MTSYRHTQRAPLCLLFYALAITFIVLGWVLQNEPPIRFLFPPLGVLFLAVAASFHHLMVEDQGDRLSISFGPIPLFRRSVKYDDIVSVEVGRTTILDGWGIHMSLRGGWVWNLWGLDCVAVRLKKGVLRVGTDDAEKPGSVHCRQNSPGFRELFEGLIASASEEECVRPESSHRAAFLLSCFTVAYNVLECVVSLIVGWWVGSVALVGFGMDSFVESLSGTVMLWRFWKHRPDEDAIEAKAVRLVGCTFFILGFYVLFESGKSLYHQEHPGTSIIGIIIALASIVVMPILSFWKNRVGKEVGSRSLVADSNQSFACALLSVALLIGLALNYALGLWWADSTAGLLIALVLLREGYETFKEGRTCC